MSRRRKRDIYGNWVWDDQEESSKPVEQGDQVKLDWKDFIALSIASLETFLLPLVIFLVIIFILAVIFAHA